MLQDRSRNRTPMPGAQAPGAAPPDAGPARAEAGIPAMLATKPEPQAALPIEPGLAEACNAQVERLKRWDTHPGSLTDEEGNAEMDRWGAVFRRAVDEPSAGLTELAAKARLMQDDMDRFFPADRYATDNYHLMRVILREVVALTPGIVEAAEAALAAPLAAAGDTALLALAARHEALGNDYLAESRRALSLEEVGKPEMPEACYVRPGDQELGLANYAVNDADGSRWYPVESIGSERRRLRRLFKRWQERVATAADPVPAGDTISKQVPWPQAILEQLDEAILAIDGQLAHAGPCADRVWRIRAEMALKRKKRQRPALQHRIAELRRAERPIAMTKPWSGHGSERREARRKAFIDAAEELLPAETFTEIWARAAERAPAVFGDAGGGVP